MSNKVLQSTSLDKIAVLLSGVCILHCLITPIAVTALPIFFMNTFVEDVLFHKLMLWLVLPSSAVALFIGCGKHRDLRIAGSGIIGMLILILVAFFGHELLSPIQERLTTTLGGLVLAVSHILNYRACQNQTCDDAECSSKHHH